MLIVGLTGGIGSGKSTANQVFEKLGIPVIDADDIARKLVEPGKPALQTITSSFGTDILDASQHLDRNKLRNLVFSDQSLRERLEQILHPLVEQEMKQKVVQLEAPYCILTIPLLIESGLFKWIDRVLVIDIDVDRQLQRIKQRNQALTDELIHTIIKTQLTREERLVHADDIVDNTGDTHQLEQQLTMLHQRYLRLANLSC